MGGRGATSAGFIDPQNMQWEQIPLSLVGENEIEGVKILRFKGGSRAKVPVESNKADTIYIVSDRSGEIKYIAEYRNHEIIFSVDLDYSDGPHGHIWHDRKRTTHDPDDIFRVPKKYEKLVKGSLDYNLRHFGKVPPASIYDKDLPKLNVRKLMRQRKKGKIK